MQPTPEPSVLHGGVTHEVHTQPPPEAQPAAPTQPAAPQPAAPSPQPAAPQPSGADAAVHQAADVTGNVGTVVDAGKTLHEGLTTAGHIKAGPVAKAIAATAKAAAPAAGAGQAIAGIAPVLGRVLTIGGIALSSAAAFLDQWRRDEKTKMPTGQRIARGAVAVGTDAIIPGILATLATGALAGLLITASTPLLLVLAYTALIVAAGIGVGMAWDWFNKTFRIRENLMKLLRLDAPMQTVPRPGLGAAAGSGVAMMALAMGANGLLYQGTGQPDARPVAVVPVAAAGVVPVNGATGYSSGDPHLTTFDGFNYDFQAAGEFTLVRATDGMEIQVRYEPISETVSVTTAVAIRVGEHRIGIYRDGKRLLVDGAPVAGQADLPGAKVANDERRALITLEDQSKVSVMWAGRMLNASVTLMPARAGKVEGLLGNYDTDDKNDLRPRGVSEPIDRGKLTRELLYERFGDSWRIEQRHTLFDYQAGQSTATFTDRAMPKVLDGNGMLTARQRTEATAACRAAGVIHARVLAECIVDVGLTGDRSFAAEAARVQPVTFADLTLGTRTTGKIEHPGDWTVYKINVPRKMDLALDLGELVPDGGPDSLCRFDVNAILLGPDGRQVWQSWIGNGGCLHGHGPISVPAPGAYQLAFTGGNGEIIKARTGTYTFALVEVPATQANPVGFGATVTGRIERLFQSQDWTFTGAAGQRIGVQIGRFAPTGGTNTCRMDINASIIGPDGKTVWGRAWIGNGGCDQAHGPITLPTNGTYRLRFDGGNGGIIRERTGGYQFSLFTVAPTDTRPLTLGATATGQIETLYAADRWTFAGAAGQTLTVTLDSAGAGCAMELHFEVRGPDDAVVSGPHRVGDGLCGRANTVNLKADGQHTLVFFGQRPNNSVAGTGPYTFLVQ